MKILIYSINYAPEFISTAKYNTELAEYLAAANHEVQVITAVPYYPNWQAFPTYRAYQYKTEIINKVKVTHCPLWIPKNPSGIKRILHLLTFGFSSLLALLRTLSWKADVIFFVEPTFVTFPGALLYSKLTKAKTWLHIQDLEIDAAFNLKFCRGSLLRKLLAKLEVFTLKRCSLISTISHQMREKIAAKGIDINKIYYFPNWVDTEIIKPLTTSSLRTTLKIAADKIVCLYSGNLGAKQGLELIIDAAELLQHDPKYVFVICGNGANQQNLQNRAKQKHLKNILWLDLQPPSQLNELLNCADLHLLPQKELIADYVLPSKLAAMMASGKPIIATALPDTEVYQLVKDCGILVAPGDAEKLAAAIQTLGSNNELRKQLGAVARSIAENNFAKNNILAKIAKVLFIVAMVI